MSTDLRPQLASPPSPTFLVLIPLSLSCADPLRQRSTHRFVSTAFLDWAFFAKNGNRPLQIGVGTHSSRRMSNVGLLLLRSWLILDYSSLPRFTIWEGAPIQWHQG